MTDKRIKEPCPFCGCKAEEIQLKEMCYGGIIYCPKCKASFDIIDRKQILIDKWNCRYR